VSPSTIDQQPPTAPGTRLRVDVDASSWRGAARGEAGAEVSTDPGSVVIRRIDLFRFAQQAGFTFEACGAAARPERR